ncbi:Catechol 1 like protein [Verticillium longisporum]|nr:Catechol 1 like protein [Verticillium longisporum]KAG7137758.1 Catechol 1 like protein [Verticillium longisporum]CRK34159.1 hypothetical protein BN1708_006302 [Verticillium longisporum]
MPRETERDGDRSEKSAPNPAASGRFGSALDLDFTARVIAATGRNANPRLAEIMPALLRHLHDFAREVELTADEWMAGIQLLNEAGQMSNDSRNETQLVCDVLGLESLVDEITSIKQGPRPSSPLQTQPPTSDARGGPKCTPKKTPTAPAPATSTPSAILGPFYRTAAPVLPANASIIHPSLLTDPCYASRLTHLTGRVLTPAGTPLANATLDVWHAAPNGQYEQQDPAQPEMHLRARLPTDPDGRFALYCLRPPPYPVPDDGPAGRLLGLLDRHPFRPAHIHFIVSCSGRRTLTTQLFDAEDPHLEDDTVFAVKEDLIAVFRPAEETDPMGARWHVDFDFVLAEAA